MPQPSAPWLCGAPTVLVVQDVLAGVAHYRDVLGFRVVFTYGEPTFYAGVERDDSPFTWRRRARRSGSRAMGPSTSSSPTWTCSIRN
jgi:hypothetical protein